MEQNGSTQNEKSQEQNQNQAEPGQGSPEVMQQESPRKCKICGGPNHHGCGCEAKAAKEWPGEDAPPDGQPASEAPAESKTFASKDELEDVLSEEAIIESHKSNIQMAKDIKTMADGFEGLCVCMYDTNNYLKLIAGDMITIRKFLTKEDDPKLIESGHSDMSDILSYLSNIEQQLKEIKAGRSSNASQNQN